jgi:DNA topoisomerase IB
MPRLRRADCSSPGITRRRAGRGFAYYDCDGARVDDPELLARIRALAIPPAWTDVWICPWPNGHIQAIGTDARGRKQYRYHDHWRLRRDQEKFDHMLEFAQALPGLRTACAERLTPPDPDRPAKGGAGPAAPITRDRALACATRLLDLGFFRIGTEGYAEQNQSYGLATIRKSHVKVADGFITFDYTAKSGKRRIQSIVDPTVCDIVTRLKARRGGGPELLAYERPDGGWSDIKSADINAFIKEVTGGDFSAKDFRTWSATVLCSVGLAVSTEARSPTARKRAIVRAVKEVAHYLGNTPAVCRASYIDPRVIDRYQAGVTIGGALAKLAADVDFGELSTHGAVEEAVLDMLLDAPDAAAA